MKTAKCISCGNRFRLHEYFEGQEKEKCFTCIHIEKISSIIEGGLNLELKQKNKKGEIVISWINRK